jgi:3'-5' exoribonuclease
MEHKTMLIKDMTEKTHVEGVYLVREKNQGMKKSGSPYIGLKLSDKTGDVKARIWDDAEKLGSLFNEGDIVRLKGWAIIYQGTLQININQIEPCAGSALSVFDYLPSAHIDRDKCFAELLALIDKINNTHLQALLHSIFDDSAIADLFKMAPAAKNLHHACVGGLLEHTLQVTKIAYDIAAYYPNVNRDLLLAGAMLHDIGKIHELSWQNNFDYTDVGRLIGHITIGVELVANKIMQLAEFPQELAVMLKHLLLSHHGEYIFASPRRPKTLEALLLNYLDDLDSKMEGLREFIVKERRPDAKWTGYNKLFDRYIYTETFIEDSASDTPSQQRD